MVKDNSLHYNVASLKGGPGYEAGPGSWRGKGKGLYRPCDKMVHVLQESLQDMKNVFDAQLAASGPPTKAKL
jgi:hypothetical protein